MGKLYAYYELMGQIQNSINAKNVTIPTEIKNLADRIGIGMEPEEIAIIPSQMKNICDGLAVLSFDQKFLTRKFQKLNADRNQIKTTMRKIHNLKPFKFSDKYHHGLACVANMHAWFRDMGVHSVKRIDGTNADIDDICMFVDETIFRTPLG